jgi:hypothetical protein
LQFFCGLIEGNLEVGVGKTRNDRRKRGKANADIIKIVWAGDNEQEVTVRHKTAPLGNRKSAFRWFEEFTMEWSETFIQEPEKKPAERENHEQQAHV